MGIKRIKHSLLYSPLTVSKLISSGIEDPFVDVLRKETDYLSKFFKYHAQLKWSDLKRYTKKSFATVEFASEHLEKKELSIALGNISVYVRLRVGIEQLRGWTQFRF